MIVPQNEAEMQTVRRAVFAAIAVAGVAFYVIVLFGIFSMLSPRGEKAKAECQYYMRACLKTESEINCLVRFRHMCRVEWLE